MEINEMEKSVDEKKVNSLSKAIKKVFNKEEVPFTAENAWLSSTYGTNQTLPIEERIANKQKDIKSVIKTKFRYPTGGTTDGHTNYSSYRCVIDIEEDLIAYKDEILKPFIDNGFKVINLSEHIEDIKDENVYLISWKNIFK